MVPKTLYYFLNIIFGITATVYGNTIFSNIMVSEGFLMHNMSITRSA